MAQEVVILEGLGDSDATQNAAAAVNALQQARVNTQNLWARAWDLKWTAYKLASRAHALSDGPLYQTAKGQDDEANRWMAVARDRISENDRLRGDLKTELLGKGIVFTPEQLAWFSSPQGLSVPDKYNASRGGTRIPLFPGKVPGK